MAAIIEVIRVVNLTVDITLNLAEWKKAIFVAKHDIFKGFVLAVVWPSLKVVFPLFFLIF